MANPNIVNVTSIYGESIGEALTTTVGTDILTVAADVVLKINYISVTNTHATTATDVTVKIVKAGFTSAGIGASEDNTGTFALASTVNLPADDVLVVLNNPIYLMSGDVLEGGATSSADIFISYEVINDA
jgi:hypothetical protein